MKLSVRFVLVALVLLVAASPAKSQEPAYKVVVHPSNPISTISKKNLYNLFLKKSTKWEDGRDARPVDLKYSSQVRDLFSRTVLGKSVSAVKSYWQQQIFSGRGVPPPMKGSDREVIRYVLSNRGAIGYVSSGANTGRVKELSVVR